MRMVSSEAFEWRRVGTASMQERTTQYVLSGVGGDGSLQRLPFVGLEVFALGFIAFSRLPHEFRHCHFAMTSAEELSASILVNHVGENSERQPRTIVLMVWLCLLSYCPPHFALRVRSLSSRRPRFSEARNRESIRIESRRWSPHEREQSWCPARGADTTVRQRNHPQAESRKLRPCKLEANARPRGRAQCKT